MHIRILLAAAVAAQLIAGVETRFNDALAARDRAALDAVLAPGFTWVHSSDGRVDTRDAFLANSTQGMALSGQRNTRSEFGVTLTMHGSNTAIRMARVRLLDSKASRESWMRQTHVLVRDDHDVWRIAHGQGTVMYEGPPLDMSTYARYAGTYLIDDKRKIVLSFEDEALFATFPNGAKSQVFLRTPTDEVTRVMGVGQLHFTLGKDGVPAAVSLMRDGKEVWRAARVKPE